MTHPLLLAIIKQQNNSRYKLLDKFYFDDSKSYTLETKTFRIQFLKCICRNRGFKVFVSICLIALELIPITPRTYMLVDWVVVIAFVLDIYSNNFTCFCTGKLCSVDYNCSTPVTEDGFRIPNNSRTTTAAATCTRLNEIYLCNCESKTLET